MERQPSRLLSNVGNFLQEVRKNLPELKAPTFVQQLRITWLEIPRLQRTELVLGGLMMSAIGAALISGIGYVAGEVSHNTSLVELGRQGMSWGILAGGGFGVPGLFLRAARG